MILTGIFLLKPEIPHYIQKPKNFDKMISLAEKLSSPFEYVRIDFYITDEDDKIYFSEYTFTPNNGLKSLSYDQEMLLGKDWI